jgi:hypothetical protein
VCGLVPAAAALLRLVVNEKAINWLQSSLTCEKIALNHPVADSREWLLDPEIIFLNHGSFGACPRHVLEFQTEWRACLERQPLQFLVRKLEKEFDVARETPAQFVGKDAEYLGNQYRLTREVRKTNCISGHGLATPQ